MTACYTEELAGLLLRAVTMLWAATVGSHEREGEFTLRHPFLKDLVKSLILRHREPVFPVSDVT